MGCFRHCFAQSRICLLSYVGVRTFQTEKRRGQVFDGCHVEHRITRDIQMNNFACSFILVRANTRQKMHKNTSNYVKFVIVQRCDRVTLHHSLSLQPDKQISGAEASLQCVLQPNGTRELERRTCIADLLLLVSREVESAGPACQMVGIVKGPRTEFPQSCRSQNNNPLVGPLIQQASTGMI